MKKNVLKKLICTALTAVCVITSVVPTFAEDVITTTEAATTKSVTSVYKYHLEGYDKKGNDLFYSKKSFYKDLNSLPSIGMGKTTVNVPAVTSKVKSVSAENVEDTEESDKVSARITEILSEKSFTFFTLIIYISLKCAVIFSNSLVFILGILK